MTGITIGGVVVHRETARRGKLGELVPRERQQRADQTAARFRADARESCWGTAVQRAQHNRFDLIVFVMGGHDVLGASPTLQISQPLIARSTSFGLRGMRSELERGGLEWQLVLLRENSDGPSDGRTVGLNAVIDVRDDENQLELRRETAQQIEQRDRIGATRHGNDRLSRLREETLPCNVREQARGQRLDSGHVS